MLLKLWSNRNSNLQVGFVAWDSPPACVNLHGGGVALLFCHDRRGNGPTFIGNVVGTHPDHGECVDLYLTDDHVRSLLDMADRTGAHLVMAGLNSEQLPTIQSDWERRLPTITDLPLLYAAIGNVGEEFGRRLAKNGISEQQFKQIRRSSCQWVNAPREFDGFVDAWCDAVGRGYDGR